MIAYIIFSKSEILIGNITNQVWNAKITKNIEEKSNLAIRYDIAMNTNGSGFINTRSCPSNVTLSGTTASGTLETISTVPYFDGTTLYCSGATSSGNLLLTYSSDFATFSTGVYTNDITLSPVGGTGTLTGSFSDPEAKYVEVSVPNSTSGLDANFNSDNYTTYSTGTIRYPDSFPDDDVAGRKTLYGYVKQDIGWYNIFWNNHKINSYIANNPNNTDPYNTTIALTQTGYLYFDLDNPWSLRVIEFDPLVYQSTKELKRLTETTYTSATGGLGWLQTDTTGTLSGTLTNHGASPLAFNFRDKNYGLFLSYSGNLTNTGADFLRYKIRAETPSGSGIYITPLDDSDPSFVKYLGNDIVISPQNEYYSKQFEVVSPKPGTPGYTGLPLENCIFENTPYECYFY